MSYRSISPPIGCSSSVSVSTSSSMLFLIALTFCLPSLPARVAPARKQQRLRLEPLLFFRCQDERHPAIAALDALVSLTFPCRCLYPLGTDATLASTASAASPLACSGIRKLDVAVVAPVSVGVRVVPLLTRVVLHTSCVLRFMFRLCQSYHLCKTSPNSYPHKRRGFCAAPFLRYDLPRTALLTDASDLYPTISMISR